MLLDTLLKNKIDLNEQQIESLESILFLNKRKSEKQKIRWILKSMKKFILLANTEFAKEIEVHPDSVEWKTAGHKKNKLKSIQKHLLQSEI